MSNYLKQGREDVFIEDSAEIEYAKFNNLRNSVMGFMLGDFDEHGVYTIDEEIVKELISLKKYIVDVIDDMQICHSVLRLNGHLTFLVSYEEDCATLSLLEKVNHEGNFKENAGSVSDINEYILDRVETSGVIDRTYFYRRWNISEFEEPAISIHDLDEESLLSLFGLVNRYKYLLYTNTIFLEHEHELEMQELAYGEEIKALLERFPKLKKVVDAAVKEKFADKKELLCLDKPFAAKAINEVIEQTIEENLDVLKKDELENFKTEKHEIQNRHNQHISMIIPHTVVKPLANAENSVGKVRVDTSAIKSTSLLELAENQAKAEAKAEGGAETAAEQPVARRPISERNFTLKELQQVKDKKREEVETRTREGYVRLALAGAIDAPLERGKAKEKDATVEPAQARMYALKKVLGSEVLKQNVTPETKKQIETKKIEKTETKKTGLVGQAAASAKAKAAAPAAKAAAPAAKAASAPAKSAGRKKKAAATKPNAKPAAKSTKPETPKSTPAPTSNPYAGLKRTPVAEPIKPAVAPKPVVDIESEEERKEREIIERRKAKGVVCSTEDGVAKKSVTSKKRKEVSLRSKGTEVSYGGLSNSESREEDSSENTAGV